MEAADMHFKLSLDNMLVDVNTSMNIMKQKSKENIRSSSSIFMVYYTLQKIYSNKNCTIALQIQQKETKSILELQ